jgi:putative ABC transport system permease protein
VNMFRQIIAVTVLNLKGMSSRFWPSFVIVISMTCVVGVLLSMMSMIDGYRDALLRAGDPGRAIILPQGTDTEGAGAIPRGAINIIKSAPGIRKDANGAAIVDAEILTAIPARKKSTGLQGYINLRSFGPEALALRPEFRLESGRMFRPGKHELIVGAAASGQFEGVNVGDKIIMPDGEWPIVGSFRTGGDVVEAQLVADTDTVMAAMRKPAFSSVIVRLTNPDALSVLRRALTSNPALSVTVERHSTYYVRRTSQFMAFFDAIAYGVATILALGALFGAVNIMSSAVSARRQQVATLRSLGFGAFPIALSVAVEAIVLCEIGAVVGVVLVWALYNGRQSLYGNNVFTMTVSPSLIGLGLAWALVIALLGGLLPSLSAARLPLAEALRAT